MMSHKRHTEEPDSPGDKRSRKFPTLKSVIEEVIKMQSTQWLEQILEPSIRRVVKEEVELALLKHFASIKRNYDREVHPSNSRSLRLRLQFLNPLSLPIFTNARVEGNGHSTLNIALIDDNGETVNRGPESSAKVEIVVLEGDFDGSGDNWTSKEFDNNIVRAREGKKPLLSGDVVMNLKDGVGLAGDFAFTDNSSWTRSRKFRLGARMVDKFNGIEVKEVKTEAFVVRDHRGELYKKHYPPLLLDEVWRLEKIGKDGAFHKRLTQANIKTVKDFLIQLFVDPLRLREILGPGMSAKTWELTVDHARTCPLDKPSYLYCPQSSELKTGVVFNITGKLLGLFADGHYVPLDKLSENEKCDYTLFVELGFSKVDAQDMITMASQNWGNVIPFDCEASSVENGDPSSPGTNSLTGNKEVRFNYAEASSCSPDTLSSLYQFSDIRGLVESPFDNIAMAYDQSQVSNLLNCDTLSLTRDFSDEDHLQYFADECVIESQIVSESQSDLLSTSDSQSNPLKTSGKGRRGWTKLFSVFKWISIRKTVVTRNRRIKDVAASSSSKR